MDGGDAFDAPREPASGRPSAVDAGRTVLGWVTCEPIRGKKFSKVIIMGPYWSGTNAVREEVLWRFRAPVLNPDKLEVGMPTPEAAEALRSSLASDSTVWEPLQAGKKLVPLGYKLLPPRESRHWRDSRQDEQPPSPLEPAPPPPPPAEPTAEAKGPPPPPAEPTAEAKGAALGARGAPPPPPPGQPPEGAAVTPGPPPGSPPREAGRPAEEGSTPAGWQSGTRHRDPQQQAAGNDGTPLERLASGGAQSAVLFEPNTDGSCPWWKHTVRQESQGEIDTDKDTLVILVTKDPFFWVKSLSKKYYELEVLEHSGRTGLDPLFGEVRFEGRRYRDAMDLWAAGVGAFLDERLYPSSRCVLLRYEDFLFRFWDVMVHLAAFLPANNQRLKESPTANRAKSHGTEVRGREEALRFYASLEGRHSGFAPEQFERMRKLPPDLLQALGYEQAREDFRGHCSWVPQLHPGDIVAAHVHVATRWPAGGAASEAEATRSQCLAWARVADRRQDDGDGVALELLREVPRTWLRDDPHDWSVVEWPARQRGSPLDLACALEQTVPRAWVDLRVPSPPCSAAALPLTEEGYRAVVSLRSTEEMADFIARVVADLEVHGARTGRIVDRRGLLGFARWFSGEAMVQSLAQIRRELPFKEAERWVTFAPPRPTRCLQEPVPPIAAEAEAGRVA